MSHSATIAPADGHPEDQRPLTAREPRRSRHALDSSLSKYSGAYIIVFLIIVYSILEPDSFFSTQNLKILLSTEAITGIITIGLVVSLISGVFDLSIGANMSWSMILVAWLQSSADIPWPLAIVLTVLSGAAIGVVNALLVSVLRVQALIGTLGMSSILAAMTYWLADGSPIVEGIAPGFRKLGSIQIFGIILPVFIFFAVAAVLWYVLEHTPIGRYLYAVGANANAAKLAGVNVVRIQWVGLVVSGVVASLAGIVLAARLGTAAVGGGDHYLLPAFSAAFLGATQVKPGRFNIWGTVLALYLLGVGVKGLELRWPGFTWIRDLFEGAVLITAVALAARSALRQATA